LFVVHLFFLAPSNLFASLIANQIIKNNTKTIPSNIHIGLIFYLKP